MPISAVYIGGSGRSGTTLLARVLGQTDGYTSVGEVRELWRLGLIGNHACACGQAFDRCPFWTQVGDEAFGGWANVDPHHALRLIESFTYRDAVVLSRRTRRDPRHTELVELLERLYRGIETAAGGTTIVDTSKGPAYGVLLAATPGLDVRAIHLVRDSRGVAYSWCKEVPKPYTPRRFIKMHRLDALSSVRWIAHHALMELLERRVPSARLRYESFMEEPRRSLETVLAAIGRPVGDPAAFPFVDDRTVRLDVDHTVAGNPNRARSGDIVLRLDADWHRGLPGLQRAQVTAMTWPMLVRYGYDL
jgi:hypothetical protein